LSPQPTLESAPGPSLPPLFSKTDAHTGPMYISHKYMQLVDLVMRGEEDTLNVKKEFKLFNGHKIPTVNFNLLFKKNWQFSFHLLHFMEYLSKLHN
jgi:hypothetical protein